MGGGDKNTVTRKGKSGRKPSLESSWITFVKSLSKDQYYELCKLTLPKGGYSVVKSKNITVTNKETPPTELDRPECAKIMWKQVKKIPGLLSVFRNGLLTGIAGGILFSIIISLLYIYLNRSKEPESKARTLQKKLQEFIRPYFPTS